ncbi:MAG: hypothetical protein ABW202_08205 [Duganella sp.]
MNAPRHIAILVFDGIQILDVTGPAAVFSAANDAAGSEVYLLHLLSEHGGPVTSNGAVTIASLPVSSLDPGAVDTLLFSGGEDDAVLQASADPAGAARWQTGDDALVYLRQAGKAVPRCRGRARGRVR